MPISAMPEHLNSEEEIDGAFPDDEQFGTTTWYGRLYRWYNKSTKTLFAFSYRCHEWWAKTHLYPKVLFAVKGKGPFRFENEMGDYVGEHPRSNTVAGGYLSRIQYYTRWHFAIQLTVWSKIPLIVPMISFHWYPKAADVPVVDQPRPELDGKLWFGYWGHFDADLVHWLITSGYLGRNWK